MDKHEKIEKWLTNRFGNHPVSVSQITREGKRRGWSYADLLNAFDKLKISSIRKGVKIYWWKPIVQGTWIWITFKPESEWWKRECIRTLNRKGFTEVPYHHWGFCPLPKTYVIRKHCIQWAEEWEGELYD